MLQQHNLKTTKSSGLIDNLLINTLAKYKTHFFNVASHTVQIHLKFTNNFKDKHNHET